MTFSFTDLASRMAMAHMPPVELLSCLITGDKALITQRIMNARMLAEADERSRLAAEMAVDDITDDPADGTPAPLAELVARVEGRSDLLAPPERSMTHRQGRGEHLESPNLSNMVLPSSPTSGGVPLSAERNVQPPRQLGLGPRGLGIGAVRVDEGIFGPPPKISITNMAEMIDRHQLRSFSTTHQQATAPPAPQAPPAPPAPQPQTSSGGKQGSKGRKGSKGKATGKERPPPPQPPAFDAPQGPQETKGPETETVGPGHLIVYLPLVQVNQQSKAKDSNVGEQASGANFKIFKKGGSVSSDRVPQASKVLPMVIVEGRVTKNEAGDAILRAETKRMEAKRKADALFGGDDEDGGGGSRAVEKRRRR